MDQEVKEAILELINKKRKVHKNTEIKLKMRKNDTRIYKQLSKSYDSYIRRIRSEYRDLLNKYDLLDKENLIEYVRFKYIGMKIDAVGIENSITAYGFLKLILEGEDKDVRKEIIDKINKDEYDEYGEYDEYSVEDAIQEIAEVFSQKKIGSNISYALRSINMENLARSNIINNLLKNEEREGIITLIKNQFWIYKYKTEATINENIEEVEKYLESKKNKIPLHNINQAISLDKIQNFKRYKNLNVTLKQMKSHKTVLSKLNFSNERNLIHHLYNEIENKPGRLNNMEYYMLERNLKHESKKVVLRTLKEIEKKYKDINTIDEILKINKIYAIKDISIYDKLGELYIGIYPDYDLYIDLINLINSIIEHLLIQLDKKEKNAKIENKDILNEIELYPVIYNSKAHIVDYRMRADFNKNQYDTYTELLAVARKRDYIALEKSIYEEIQRDINRII